MLVFIEDFFSLVSVLLYQAFSFGMLHIFHLANAKAYPACGLLKRFFPAKSFKGGYIRHRSFQNERHRAFSGYVFYLAA
jgi:hypothetical protein